MPRRNVTGFSCRSTKSQARPRDSTDGSGANSASIVWAGCARGAVAFAGAFDCAASKRAGIAAALFHAGDHLLLLFGRHGLEALEHAGLEVAATAAAPPPAPPRPPPTPFHGLRRWACPLAICATARRPRRSARRSVARQPPLQGLLLVAAAACMRASGASAATARRARRPRTR